MIGRRKPWWVENFLCKTFHLIIQAFRWATNSTTRFYTIIHLPPLVRILFTRLDAVCEVTGKEAAHPPLIGEVDDMQHSCCVNHCGIWSGVLLHNTQRGKWSDRNIKFLSDRNFWGTEDRPVCIESFCRGLQSTQLTWACRPAGGPAQCWTPLHLEKFVRTVCYKWAGLPPRLRPLGIHWTKRFAHRWSSYEEI